MEDLLSPKHIIVLLFFFCIVFAGVFYAFSQMFKKAGHAPEHCSRMALIFTLLVMFAICLLSFIAIRS